MTVCKKSRQNSPTHKNEHIFANEFIVGDGFLQFFIFFFTEILFTTPIIFYVQKFIQQWDLVYPLEALVIFSIVSEMNHCKERGIREP